MNRFVFLFLIFLLVVGPAMAQVSAGLFRYPDVSQTHIVFTYGNDLWTVPKTGGAAARITKTPGVESFPKFSPTGDSLAFTANYDGNQEAYVMPAAGGLPARLTYHGYTDRVVDWHPQGGRVLFASSRESEKQRYNQFYTVAASGGFPEKLPLPYAEFGSFSPDGKQLALTFRTQVFRNWKRYRGGWNADIHIFNLTTHASENISATTDAGDELPMWHGNKIYFLSDRGKDMRMNLWEYDLASKNAKQLTTYTDYDVHFPSIGPSEMVFEAGGKLYLYPLAGGQPQEVTIQLTADRASLKPSVEMVHEQIQQVSLAPDGNRVLVQARGDVFSLPAEEGFVKNLTQTSGVAERYPAWSPDGKKVAYWSDRSGEYELTLRETGNGATERKLTSYGPGFRYRLFWSPDSKKLAFIDKAMKIRVYDTEKNQTYDVDSGLRMSHYNLETFDVSWSPDSRWLTYSRDLENNHAAVFVYDLQTRKRSQATSGYYNSYNPVFDPEGKYLVMITDQHFDPAYSSIDNTFIYANSSQIAALSLKKTTPSPVHPKNDTVSVSSDAKTDEKSKDKKSKDDKDTKDKDDASKRPPAVTIDLDGMEQRIVLLPPAPGNYTNLRAVKGKLIYQHTPNTGSGGKESPVKFFDLEKREEKTIIENVDYYLVSANGEKLLVKKDKAYAVIKPEEKQKMEKTLPVADMKVLVEPVAEWKQLFTDAWRLERDYFYDPNLHGVNWNQTKERYQRMLDGALTREEVNFVIGEMIGELNASHTYKGGGSEETAKEQSVGYLGVNWQADGKHYKIRQIIRGAPWDAEARSPLDMPGVNVKEGDYILAVNGVPLTTEYEPHAAFQGLAGKTVELTYNASPSVNGAKTAVVKTLSDEYRLRHLAWIEQNRQRVEKATNGDVGYVYVTSTGVDGQNELIRQFNAQWNKKGLVIDERFNDGGQIPDRFIEILNRPPLVYWAIRDGENWPWPPFAHFGPKVMLMNGWSGSGGDAFPDYFRKKGLGPLIGSRTWGGLIGISGVPELMDGGGVTVPTFRMYNVDGTWFKEGHGVDPDIDVPENLTDMAKGVDTQLVRAIEEMQQLLKSKSFTVPKSPSYEVR